jgi:hypothetical protein
MVIDMLKSDLFTKNISKKKSNENEETMDISEKLFGRKIEDDEIIGVRFGDLREAFYEYTKMTIRELDEIGCLNMERFLSKE